MPDEEVKPEIVPVGDPEDQPKKITAEQKMAMLFAELGDDNLPNLNPEQIDKLIEERSKVNGYISKDKENQHEERMEDKKNELHYLYVGSFLIIAVFGLVLKFKPELLGEALAFLAGSGGGFGLGKYRGLKSKKDDN